MPSTIVIKIAAAYYTVLLLVCSYSIPCLLQVHDIAFTRACGGRDLFASVGSDGSVRLFDLRLVQHQITITAVVVNLMREDSFS